MYEEGRARTPCRLARRGDVDEHHVVGDPAREKNLRKEAGQSE